MDRDLTSVHVVQFQGTGVFNPDTLQAAHAALDAALADSTAEVLMLQGEGKNFSQGLDLDYLMAHQAIFPQFVIDVMHLAGRLLTFPLPVVSVVNGHAFGLGAMLVLASDYAVMRADRGFFCLPEIDIGMTLSVRMNALVSSRMQPKALRDSLLVGGRLTGPEALNHRIVDAVGDVPDLVELGLQQCQPMRGKPRELLAGLKYGASQALVDLIFSDADDTPIKAPVFGPRQ